MLVYEAGKQTMSSPKAEVTEMLNGLPDSSSLEDIQYHLYVLEKIKHGLTQADEEGALSHDEAKARLARWLVA